MPRLVVTLPPRPAASGGTDTCTPSGPYLVQSISEFPVSGQLTHIFGIYGLAETDEVVWDTSGIGPDDYVAGQSTLHVLAVVYVAGEGGTVSASVNGVVIGSASYLPV